MRLGVVSDVHCQAGALDRALAAMGAIDRLICLGDAINQFGFCNATVGRLVACDALAVLGNHEEAFFAGPGLGQVDPALAVWLASRPTRIETVFDGVRTLIVHSTPWPSDHAYVPATHRDFHRFASPDFDLVLYGHTHQPVVAHLGGTLVVNPGSTGEGRPAPHGFIRSCAVFDTASRQAVILDLD
jgi:uncharacterized protein